MKLLLVGNFLSASRGTRFYCEDLAERLAGRGHDVQTTSRCDGRLARILDILLTIVRRYRHYDLAVVDCYSGSSFVWAEAACRLLDCLSRPYVLVLHGGALPEFRSANPRRFRRLLQRAPLVATPSVYLQQSFSDLRSDIRYLPNALDISLYVWKPRISVEPKLIWLRAFLESYQPYLAIQTLAGLVAEFPDAFLSMIGPDKGDNSLMASQALADSIGVSEQIKFLGVVKKKKVPDRLQDGDIYLNTTRYESFGVAVLEAAACGLPIVSTSVGEIPYLWMDEEDILLVSPKDPGTMIRAVKRILAEPGLAEKLSRNARKKAEGFDWSVVLPKWEILFEDLGGSLN